MINNKINAVNIKQLIAGWAILLFGVVIYLLDRQPDQILFISTFGLPSFYNPGNIKIFGELSNNLPSFLHVCSFSLLTCALLTLPSKNKYLIVCLSWAAINILFEAGQLIKPNLPVFLSDNKILMYVFYYFQYGSFDFLDILFALLGSFFAYCFLIITFKGGSNEIESISIE